MFSYQRPPIDWDEVGNKLKDKGALKPCPRCGQSKFHYAGTSDIPLDTPTTNTYRSAVPQALPRPSSIPTIIISCDNCGYLMQHSIGILLSERNLLEKI